MDEEMTYFFELLLIFMGLVRRFFVLKMTYRILLLILWAYFDAYLFQR